MRPGGLPFGAILAGGQSRRFGSQKALATVGGVRIIDRVVEAVRSVVPDVVLLANEPDLFSDLALPARPDVRPGVGALGGIHTALLWARETDRPGVLAVACDMPFPCQPLLARLVSMAFSEARDEQVDPVPDVVIPESRGPRGVEPLCAAYGVGCIEAIEAQLDAGDQRMIGFHAAVHTVRIPVADVEAVCDPQLAFLNVNTPGERDRAERLAESRS